MFLVDKVNSPFETSELHKIGWSCAPTGEIYFKNCRVPKENALSSMVAKALSGKGSIPISEGVSKLYGYMSPLSAIFCMMRSGMALMATGISQACLDAARLMSSLAKDYACEGCVKVAYYAIQIHGGLGLSDEYPLERYFRDARMMIPDSTTEIQKLVVGRELLGKEFSAYV